MIARPPRAGAEAAAALAQLMARAFDPRFGEAWNTAQVAAVLAHPGGLCRLTRADGVLTGFSLARLAGPEAEILLIAVLPEYWRRGLARRLLAAIVEDAQDHAAEAIFLEVREHNHPARALYAAHGFAVVGRRPGYYAGVDHCRHDALTMRLTLGVSSKRN